MKLTWILALASIGVAVGGCRPALPADFGSRSFLYTCVQECKRRSPTRACDKAVPGTVKLVVNAYRVRRGLFVLSSYAARLGSTGRRVLRHVMCPRAMRTGPPRAPVPEGWAASWSGVHRHGSAPAPQGQPVPPGGPPLTKGQPASPAPPPPPPPPAKK